MRKSFKFKLYNSKKNKYFFDRINISGIIYNHCIALHRRYYKLTGKFLNCYRFQKHIAKLKKLQKYKFWKLVPSQAIQDIASRIDKAYQKFFKYKAGKTFLKCGLPKFKKVKKYKSFTLKQAGCKLLTGNKIKIGKKVFKYSKSRDIEGDIKTLTIKRDCLGDYYLIFSCDNVVSLVPDTTTGKSAGFDFGLKTFLTPSNDMEDIQSPLFFLQASEKIKKAGKNHSNKVRGSNNRKRAKLELAKIHKTIADKRKDFHFKLANKLIQTYDYLFFETLNIKAMQRLWGKKISDLGFSEFIKILEFKCIEYGKTIKFISKWFPSSKTCNICGYINNNLTLKDRKWDCPSCGSHLDRDLNAAINIKNQGILLV